jgi:hypothetical protein
MAAAEVPSAPPARPFLTGLLSVTLLLLLADGLLTVAAEGLVLAGRGHPLHAVTLPVFLLALVAGTVVYVLMGFIPEIPKRVFVPVTLFSTVVLLALLPVLIYHPAWLRAVLAGSALLQAAVVLAAWAWGRRGLSFAGWPLVPAARLRPPDFSGSNLASFTVANLLFLAATLAYLGLCAGMAVSHFSAGFLILHPGHLEVRAKTYLRDDGKRVLLIPLVHLGSADFYRKAEAMIPPSAVILREGVTDRRGLLAFKIDSTEAAQDFGLADPPEAFAPPSWHSRPADLDVFEFAPATRAMIEMVSQVYAEGWFTGAIPALRESNEDPHLFRTLAEDLLVKRNAHLLAEMDRALETSDQAALPWGAAHMPGLEAALRKEGFHLKETRAFSAIPLGALYDRLWQGAMNVLVPREP